MKKFIKVTALLFSIFTLSLSVFIVGCASSDQLSNHLSELKSDIFYGESQNYTIKASYGFIETPYVNDGAVKTIENTLSFRLVGKESDNTSYSVTLSFNGKDYKSDFKFHPVNDTLSATIIIDDFNQKEFSVNIVSASLSEKVVLKSILPKDTLDYKTALNHLNKEQASLIKSYLDADGNFTAEIYMRVLVKDEKPYYYVGFASGNDKLKALLVDGLTGKTLAIREIF